MSCSDCRFWEARRGKGRAVIRFWLRTRRKGRMMTLTSASDLLRSFDTLNLTLKWKLLEPNLLVAESGMCLYLRVGLTAMAISGTGGILHVVDLAGKENGPRLSFTSDPNRPATISLRVHIRAFRNPAEVTKQFVETNPNLSPHNVVFCLKSGFLLIKSDMKDFIPPKEPITSATPGSVVFARAQDCLVPGAPGVVVTLWCYRKIDIEELRARTSNVADSSAQSKSQTNVSATQNPPRQKEEKHPSFTKLTKPIDLILRKFLTAPAIYIALVPQTFTIFTLSGTE